MPDILTIIVNQGPIMWFAYMAFLMFFGATVVGIREILKADAADFEFRQKNALMPGFDRLREAKVQLEVKQRERDELMTELKELRQEQAEIERHSRDAEHWQNLATQAKQAYENRQDMIDAVESIRTQYEDAANDLATRNEELAQLNLQYSRISSDIDEARQRLKELEETRQEAEDLSNQLDELKRQRENFINELTKIQDQREERLRSSFEVEQLSRRKDELDRAIQTLPEKVSELERKLQDLRDERDELLNARRELLEVRNETDRLNSKNHELTATIAALEETKRALEGSVASVSTAMDGSGGDDIDEKEKIIDLQIKPSCLFDHNDLALPNTEGETDEILMLQRLEDYLKELNLDFDNRTLFRFHTSLKTSYISPLTVLAGISGTGKSQLPQRYAEAMGIHFLKVAVQPRWDSPQDLLGFYNYLEQSYKATDLARALVRMDRNFELSEGEMHAEGRMLLVLLDEMNLARVEYYFSEFLSRLEARPESEIHDRNLLLPSMIDIDIPSKSGSPLSVYPGHNILFVGTMNEDESTQALSDKVLDRSNTLRFRKPEKLEENTLENTAASRNDHLPFETWENWRKKASDLQPQHREQVSNFVEELNGLLEKIGRPFGHRVSQAIHAYVANYPGLSLEKNVHHALSDTLALRILPKLRGIELEDSTPNTLRQIAAIAQDLGNEELAESIKVGIGAHDVFHWTG